MLLTGKTYEVRQILQGNPSAASPWPRRPPGQRRPPGVGSRDGVGTLARRQGTWMPSLTKPALPSGPRDSAKSVKWTVRQKTKTISALSCKKIKESRRFSLAVLESLFLHTYSKVNSTYSHAS